MAELRLKVSLDQGRTAADLTKLISQLEAVEGSAEGIQAQGLDDLAAAAKAASLDVVIAADNLQGLGAGVDTLSGEARAAGDSLEGLGASARAANQGVGGIGDEARGAGEGLGGLGADARQAQEEMEGLIRLSGALGTDFGQSRALAQSLNLTSQEAAQAADALQALRGSGATTEEQFQALNKTLGLSRGQFDGLSKAQSGEGLQGFSGRIGQLAEDLDKAALKTLALAQAAQQVGQAGQQINQFSGTALAAAAAFDSAKAKVSTLSDDADGLASTMQNLAQELGFQTNSTELLNASYDVLSSGFTDTADNADILRNSVLAAKGGFSDVGTVSDAVTTVLNAYGKSADEAGKVTDILIATQDRGKITVGQYASQIGKVASIASQAGISIEEVSGAVATATVKGVRAESAVSGTRQALVNLIKPTAEAQKLLEQFGISNASATLKSEGLVGILQRLQDQGATSDDLAKIFSDVDGLAVVATLAGDNLADFKGNLDAVSNSSGSAAAAAAKIAGSFEGQTTAALNQANEALVSLGNGVKTAVTPLVAAISFLLENFNALPEPIKGAVGVLIALTGGALTVTGALFSFAAVFPVIKAGFTAISGGGVQAGVGMAASAVGANTATGSFTAAGAAIGKVALTIGLALAAIYALQQAWQSLAGVRLGAELQGTAEELEKIRGTASQAAQAAQSAGPSFDGLKQGVTTFLSEIQSEGFADAWVRGFQRLYQATGIADEAMSEYGQNLRPITGKQLVAQQATLGLGKTQKEVFATLDQGTDILKKYGLEFFDASDKTKLGAKGIQEFSAAAKDQIGVLDESIDTLKKQSAALPEEGTAKQLLNDQIVVLEKQRGLLDKRITQLTGVAAAQRGANQATDASAAALEEQAEALKEAQEAANQQREEAFNAQQGEGRDSFQEAQQAAQEKFQEEQAAKQEALQEKQAAEQEALQARQAAEQEALQEKQAAEKEALQAKQASEQEAFRASQEALAKAFNASERELDKQAAKERQEAEKAFAESQRAEAKAFQEQQNAEKKAFEDGLRAEEKAAQGQFDERRQQIDRQLQLDEAESPAERKRLEKQFQEQDEKEAKRREAFAQVDAEESAFKQQVEARRSQFDEGQEQARNQFQQGQEGQRDQFQEGQQTDKEAGQLAAEERRAQFELAQQEEQKAFELAQQEEQKAFELAQQEEQKAFQLAQRAEQKAFDAEQKAEQKAFDAARRQEQKDFEFQQKLEQKAFDAEQRAQEALFKAEQRRLDKQNAAEIAALLSNARSAPPQGRYKGGPVAAGVPYVVGERGEELFVPSVDGKIINHRQTAAILADSEKMGTPSALAALMPEIAPLPRLGVASSSGPGQANLLRQVIQRLDGLQAALESRPRPIQHNEFNLGGGQQDQRDVVSLQQQLLAAQIRRGGLG